MPDDGPRRWPVVVLLVVVLAGACSSDNVGSDTNTPAATASSEPSTPTTPSTSSSPTPGYTSPSGLEVTVAASTCDPVAPVATLEALAAAHADSADTTSLVATDAEYTLADPSDQLSMEGPDELNDYLAAYAGPALEFTELELRPGIGGSEPLAFYSGVLVGGNETFFVKGAVTCDGTLLSWVISPIQE